MKNKYVDIKSIIQVIGCIYQNPSLLDNSAFTFSEDDFTEEFHKVVFGSIYNLHNLGATIITPATIKDYLNQRPKKLAVYTAFKGDEWLQESLETTSVATFKYYYDRMKKM